MNASVLNKIVKKILSGFENENNNGDPLNNV